VDASTLGAAIKAESESARASYARDARLEQRVQLLDRWAATHVACGRTPCRWRLETALRPAIVLETGNILCNAVRDGTGCERERLSQLRDFNYFPRIHRALEERVLPSLADSGQGRSRGAITGCA